MIDLKPGFSRFLGADPDRLHFAAHSHHPWPDVTYEAHKRAWLDAAALMDDKWEHIFQTVVPETSRRIARILGLSSAETITFAPNTHEFVVRLFSCLEPPVRVLTTDSEFHSMTRQLRRWEESGLAIADRVSTEPFDTFSERFTKEARAGVHDLVFFSRVFFDSGMAVEDADRIVASVSEQRAFVVVDGYHAFMARPVDLGSIQDRAFFLAGGYKYAMAGEGICFLHVPPGYGPRPVDTGWYAGFGQLESGVTPRVEYAETGSRFAGATYDPSGVYRMNAVLGWLEEAEVEPAHIAEHVRTLQDAFLSMGPMPGELLPPNGTPRGSFLTFRTEQAEKAHQRLHEMKVITDHRRDRLRIGFGVYHDLDDVERLGSAMRSLGL